MIQERRQNEADIYIWGFSKLGGLCTGGEGNGNPLQYSCLENPLDGGAWQATVHGITKRMTNNFTFHFMYRNGNCCVEQVFRGRNQGLCFGHVSFESPIKYADQLLRYTSMELSKVGSLHMQIWHKSFTCQYQSLGLPRWLSSKESACQAGDARDADSILGLWISPGEENVNPLQYSCLENPMDRGTWWGTHPVVIVHGVAKSWTLLSN